KPALGHRPKSQEKGRFCLAVTHVTLVMQTPGGCRNRITSLPYANERFERDRHRAAGTSGSVVPDRRAGTSRPNPIRANERRGTATQTRRTATQNRAGQAWCKSLDGASLWRSATQMTHATHTLGSLPLLQGYGAEGTIRARRGAPWAANREQPP